MVTPVRAQDLTDRRAPRTTEDFSGSTFPDQDDLAYQRREHLFRVVFAVVLAAFLIAALVGVFGVRTATASASGDGYEMSVRYGRVTRPGLATPWEVEVVAESGFDGPIVIETDADYFDLFDENGLDPEPTSSISEGDKIQWEFDPPEGSRFVLSFDARIEPAVHRGRTATTSLLDEEGNVIVSVDYTTTVFP